MKNPLLKIKPWQTCLVVPRRINRAVLIKFLVVDFQQLIPNILLVVICIMVPRFSTQDLLAWMPCVGVSPLSPCVSDQNDATFELNNDVLTVTVHAAMFSRNQTQISIQTHTRRQIWDKYKNWTEIWTRIAALKDLLKWICLIIVHISEISWSRIP